LKVKLPVLESGKRRRRGDRLGEGVPKPAASPRPSWGGTPSLPLAAGLSTYIRRGRAPS